MKETDLKLHYLQPIVRREVVEFCRGRWVAVHFENGLRMARYFPKGDFYVPLTIKKERDLDKIMGFFPKLRTLYATVERYVRLETIEDAFNGELVEKATPTWDIDNELCDWKTTLKAASLVIDELRNEGVEKSFYLIWSGKGVHVHLNENSIPDEVFRRYGALDVAWAVTEYVKRKVETKLFNLKVKNGFSRLRIDNEVKPRAVFTSVLSVHRELDLVTVAIDPSKIDEFSPDSARPANYSHFINWKEYRVGEAEEIVERALKVIGRYPAHVKRRRRFPPVDEMIKRALTEK